MKSYIAAIVGLLLGGGILGSSELSVGDRVLSGGCG